GARLPDDDERQRGEDQDADGISSPPGEPAKGVVGKRNGPRDQQRAHAPGGRDEAAYRPTEEDEAGDVTLLVQRGGIAHEASQQQCPAERLQGCADAKVPGEGYRAQEGSAVAGVERGGEV